MDAQRGDVSAIEDIHPNIRDTKELASSSSVPVHAAPELLEIDNGAQGESAGDIADEIQASKKGWFAYFKTKDFYLVLLLGYGFPILPVLSKRRSIVC